MVWDKVEFPCSVKTMHRLWDFAWKSHPDLASFPSCSAPPTQEHFPKESLAGTPYPKMSPSHGIFLTLYHQVITESHWVCLLNIFGTCLVLSIPTVPIQGQTHFLISIVVL